MLNAVCETKLKSVDYKSIALPAELQGLFVNLYRKKNEFQFKSIIINKLCHS